MGGGERAEGLPNEEGRISIRIEMADNVADDLLERYKESPRKVLSSNIKDESDRFEDDPDRSKGIQAMTEAKEGKS